MKIFNFIVVFSILFSFVQYSQAKNCPSKLSSNLRQIGEKELYIGFETRLVNFLYQETDLTQDPPQTDFMRNGYMALRGMVNYMPLDWLELNLESEVKLRSNAQGCNSWAINTKNGNSIIPQLRGLNAIIDKDNYNLKIGRQNLVFGTQALLDNFFDAVVFKKKINKKINFELFGGILAKEITRETIGCGYENYYEKRRAWKHLCTSSYGDYLIGGLKFNFKHFKPHRISLINLFQWSNLDSDNLTEAYPENLTTNFLSLYISGPILGSEKWNYETELLGAFKIYDQTFIPAGVFGILYFINFGKLKISFNPSYVGSFSPDSEHHFASVFESFDIGSRQRYGLYDGHIWSFMTKFKYKKLRFKVGYHYHTNDFFKNSIDDEIEAGMTLFLGSTTKYQLRAIYSALNVFAGELSINHGIRFVARIVF